MTEDRNVLLQQLESLRAENARLKARLDATPVQAADLVRKREELYRDAISHFGGVVYLHDYASRAYLHLDEGIKKLTGYDASRFTSDFWGEIILKSIMCGPAEGVPKLEVTRRVEAGEMPNWQAEYLIETPEGEERWLSDHAINFYDAEGKVTGSLGILQDITARKRAEEEARHRETEQKRAEEGLRFLNKRLGLLARATGAIVGAAPPTEQALSLAELAREAFEVDACIIRVLEGEELVLLTSVGAPVDRLAPRLDAHLGISDMILLERRTMTIPDVREHPMTAPLVQQSPHLYSFVSYAGAPLLTEDRVIGILGLCVEKERREFSETDLEHLQIIANQVAVSLLNERLYKEVQSQRDQLDRQIVEREALEAQLQHAQKMESVGRLAGGIAHDFNNLLTAILGFADLAAEDLPADSPLLAPIHQIQNAANRAADLTSQLLTFARKQIIQPRLTNLNDVLLNVDKLLRRLIGADIDLVTLPQSGLASALVDPAQFEQILLNLAINARDAMPQGGKLTIETANIYLDADYARHHAEVVPGWHILLAVSDTGMGMEEAVRARLFEPFFTTKEMGKGTGLGLATCYGIVKQAGGYIWVYSEAGKGTTFKIYLPQAQGGSEPLDAVSEERALGGTETILLVEDEPLVREIGERALRGQGYTVLLGQTGSDALELARGYAGEIHLLVTDVVMPQMNGRRLAELLQLERPGIKVLYVSGYTENSVVHHGVLEERIAFLPKPFTPSLLARKVRQMLREER